MKNRYNEGRIPSLIEAIVRIIKEMPDALENRNYLMANLYRVFPALKDREFCANCRASMVEYVVQLDVIGALLLLQMAEEIENASAGIPQVMEFKDLNRVKVQHLKKASYAIKSKTTQISKLGLIAKVMHNKKQIPGVWLITTRGWAGLRGEEIPISRIVWRNEIQERTEGTTTLAEVFKGHKDKVQYAIANNKEPKSNYLSFTVNYSPQNWVKYGELHEGKIL